MNAPSILLRQMLTQRLELWAGEGRSINGRSLCVHGGVEHARGGAVGAFACGMRVEVPIHSSLLPGGTSAEGVWQTLADR